MTEDNLSVCRCIQMAANLLLGSHLALSALVRSQGAQSQTNSKTGEAKRAGSQYDGRGRRDLGGDGSGGVAVSAHTYSSNLAHGPDPYQQPSIQVDRVAAPVFQGVRICLIIIARCFVFSKRRSPLVSGEAHR